MLFFFSSRRRHTRYWRDWSSDVCSSDLIAVIAGEGELGRKLAERIQGTPFLGIRFSGYFDDRSPERIGGVKPGEILGSLNQIAEYAKTHRVDLIYITLPMASQPRILKLLEELRDTTASIYFTPD